jgi:hypothetical protein
MRSLVPHVGLLALVACGGATEEPHAAVVAGPAGPVGGEEAPRAPVDEGPVEAPPDPFAAVTATPPDRDPGRDGSTPLLAVQRCGAPKSYSYVAAEFECPGGGNPFGGDLARGAGARVGNVGSGPDGHVLDLYEIPCPSGPVRIYVDLYHCPPGQTPY